MKSTWYLNNRPFEVERLPDGMLRISRDGDPYFVDVKADKLQSWRDGVLIQNAMPELTNEQREFLVSGFTPTMWSQMFGEDEEEV